MCKSESVEAASSVFATENGGFRPLGTPKYFLLPFKQFIIRQMHKYTIRRYNYGSILYCTI